MAKAQVILGTKMCSLSKRSTSGIVHTIAMSCRTPDRPGVPQRPGSTGADDIATESTAFPKAHRIDRVCPNGPGQPGPTTLQRRARRFHIALSVLLLLLLLLLCSFFPLLCQGDVMCSHVQCTHTVFPNGTGQPEPTKQFQEGCIGTPEKPGVLVTC